jgi:outer membrane receptor protein involved in Fe transport
VELAVPGSEVWIRTQPTQVLRPHFRLRTGVNSRATLRWTDNSVVPIGELTEIQVLLPHQRGAESGLQLIKGVLSFFHRDQPGRIRVMTAGATAGIEGTEFVMEVAVVDGVERSTLSVIDGRVSFSNDFGALLLTNRQQALAVSDAPPVLQAGFVAENILQWAFYYPAVVDLRDLPLTPEEKRTLGDSLAAYRAGDVRAALTAFPEDTPAPSDAWRMYRAALLLAAGQAGKAEVILEKPLPPGSRSRPVAAALRTLIAAVNRRPAPLENPQLSSELLAASYYEQSKARGDVSLERALELAQASVARSPDFGFGWARVAELELSFGRTRRVRDALQTSLALAPRNAQALASKGFLLTAENRTREALAVFDEALAVDSALGNAWLGRGLARLRRGDRHGGRRDLLMAAALEPHRALLRSYLGRAWSDTADDERALHELELARSLDSADPTAWLYTAVIKQRQNRINEAIEDLETSQAVGENRRLYTAQVLLDEQRAVRGVNLATAYRRAGLERQSLREAAQAVSQDYSSYAAHQFLSDSFHSYRDPARFNLRFETAWFNERLLANLLGRVGATPLSQHFAQHEYSSLFAQDGAHVSSLTEYRSDGQLLELASQYGRFGDTAWALDLDYQRNEGVRPNNRLHRLEGYGTVKHQLSLQGSVMLLMKFQDYESGDNFQYYAPTNARPRFRFDERQSPLALLAYHHEWQPGVHTLFLGGRLHNDQTLRDFDARQFLLRRNATGQVAVVQSPVMDVRYRSQLEIYTAELNQILRHTEHTLVAGGRYQAGHFETRDRMTLSAGTSTNLFPFYNDPPAADVNRDAFERLSVYGYYTWQPLPEFYLTPGLSYDQVRFPRNHRSPPIAEGEERRRRLNPKFGAVWSPDDGFTLRGAYSRSLGGVSFDESFRLEPAQLAGFQQSFRSIISESLAGSVSAPIYETAGLALDWNTKGRTFFGLQADALGSDVRRRVGVFNRDVTPPLNLPSSTRQHLDYEEHAVSASVHQLLSDEWAAGAEYRFTRSELRTRFPDVPIGTPGLDSDQTERADLQQVTLRVRFNHPSGFFAYAESQFYHQHNHGYDVPRPDENLFQQNLFAGYRLRKELGELSFGVLNLLDEDYRLNPLNPYLELPRERVFVVRLRFNL